MDMQQVYRVLADGVLALHVGVVLFVIFGLVLTLLGGAMGWGFVRSRWFRVAHLATIAVIVAQSWGGVVCPLTILESGLRRLGGQSGYGDLSFVGYWLRRVLFYRAEPWVFIAGYSTFGALVLLSFWLVPVRWKREPQMNTDEHG